MSVNKVKLEKLAYPQKVMLQYLYKNGEATPTEIIQETGLDMNLYKSAYRGLSNKNLVRKIPNIKKDMRSVLILIKEDVVL